MGNRKYLTCYKIYYEEYGITHYSIYFTRTMIGAILKFTRDVKNKNKVILEVRIHKIYGETY